jgi:hypothetical protein
MKTISKTTSLLLVLAAGIVSLATPALADHREPAARKYDPVSKPTHARRSERTRSDQNYSNQHQRWHQRNQRQTHLYDGPIYQPRYDRGHDWRYGKRRRHSDHHYGDRYRVPASWRAVRGKIIRVGRGRYEGCFRVKRQGRYQQQKAIVTVRYCENHYGEPVKVRGSKRLIRYLQPVYYNW